MENYRLFLSPERLHHNVGSFYKKSKEKNKKFVYFLYSFRFIQYISIHYMKIKRNSHNMIKLKVSLVHLLITIVVFVLTKKVLKDRTLIKKNVISNSKYLFSSARCFFCFMERTKHFH